jgi:chromosome segregation ATPase
MENLKRKLSVARRPETGNRELIRELNKYKQNNVALQKQIESLMAKLNQSKKNERGLAATLEEIEKRCTEWQEKASKAEQLEKSTLALQNTIDHLEHRLEMANVEKLDAEEQIWNLQTGRSPFDPTPPKLRVPEITTFANNRQSVRESMSTIFSAGSPTDHAAEVQDSSTLAAFISHIERLQEQVKQKEEMISQLEKENKHLRHGYENLEREHNESSLRLDIQGQLLNKSKESEAHIEQLRSAIIEREAVIGEKEKALRMAERQLEHHKLLLHAEIRRHSTLSLFANAQDDSLPDLASLASKEDIDRWISRLQTRLKKEKSVSTEQEPYDDPAALIKDLRQEIDFYVREIIYYKLDIKGYKSDIKKMKHIATRMGTYGSRASDIESPTPSQCRSTDTPTRIRLSSGTPGLGISNTSSPVSIGPMSASISIRRPVTPAPAGLPTPDPSPADTIKPTLGTEKGQGYATTPMTPRTPPRSGANVANEADSVEPGISPRSVARLSPERRKPTVRYS